MVHKYIPAEVIQQSHLEQVVRSLFPHENVIYNSRKKSQVSNISTGYFFEIDVWVPDLHLGFEFQDSYHYMNTWFGRQPLDSIQTNDDNKREAVSQSGTTLICVPCWWDGNSESLVATIKFERPDLLEGRGAAGPIILNPGPNFFPKEELPGVGALMLASFPLDPNFNQSITSDTWWMGEKYDGVRGCWNPHRQVVNSRSGREIPLLDVISASLPKVYVDGEFWFGRGNFNLIYSLIVIVKSDKNNVSENLWTSLRMISFDYPHHSFHHLPFEQRYELLLHSISSDHPLNIIAQRMMCKDSLQLDFLIRKIVEYGGEGLMLRRAGSLYERGRNTNLIKLKSAYGDTEGLVVAVNPTAVSLKLPNGQVFKVPMEKVLIASPPLQPGEVVTFSYEKLARRELPVHVSITRRRSEMKWEDVVVATTPPQYSHQHVQESENFTTHSRGFWTIKNMREKMEKILKLDYLSPPSSWSSLSINSIRESKEGRTILKKFGNVYTLLTSLFHDINPHHFDKFKKEIRNPWISPIKRRGFFEKYAKERKFDFLSPANWYSQPLLQIRSLKGAEGVIEYHNGSVAKALVDLFPDIGLEKSKFKFLPPTKTKLRQKFKFFAKEKNFDPLVAENWGKWQRRDFHAEIRQAVHGSIASALIRAYPDVTFDESQLPFSYKHWTNVKNRKKHLENFSKKNEFDPLIPENWYSVSYTSLKNEIGSSILNSTKGNATKLILECFPNIGLDIQKFNSTQRYTKKESESEKRFDIPPGPPLLKQNATMTIMDNEFDGEFPHTTSLHLFNQGLSEYRINL